MPHSAILRLEQVEVLYEGIILAVRGLSLEVREGQVVALIGANGAGKSSCLKAISNLVTSERGEVASGRIFYRGQSIGATPPSQLAALGLVQVLEGRRCFAQLTVEENLLVGAFVRRPSRRTLKVELERIYGLFPRLRERRSSLAGYTSGGEQQMIALGRALMARPRLVLLDEPSMGLAPQMVEEIFEIVGRLNRQEGVSFLIAEQNLRVALGHAHYAYVLENGRVAGQGEAAALAAQGDLAAFYLGRAAD
ncbi:MAG: ABC transporter ATP-binding protein [Pseudomonas sp.]|uniref:ABC transporter ATP-binding protein n=1 Tax=Pseudomonas sp. TaxID=306 RepID=UPI00339758C8